VFTGVAGGLKQGQRVGELVVGEDVINYEMDARAFRAPWEPDYEYQLGEIPMMKWRVYEADKTLLNLAMAAPVPAGVERSCGRLASGSIFLDVASKYAMAQTHWKLMGWPAAAEMENAGVAQICKAFGVPYVSLRALSDVLEGDANEDFGQFCQVAADNVFPIVHYIAAHYTVLPTTTTAVPRPLAKRASNKEFEDIPPITGVDIKAANVVLYETFLSPPCWKVRALLHYYKVPYTSKLALPGVPWLHAELDASYLKIPCITLDGQQINDSAVIYKAVAPLVGGAMTPSQAELERLNNIHGLMGAHEVESLTSFFGIVGFARGQLKMVLQMVGLGGGVLEMILRLGTLWLGLLCVLTKLAAGSNLGPLRKLDSSVAYGRQFKAALGAQAFFHGDAIGPLDLSLYGVLAMFVWCETPAATAVLDGAGLRAWYGRVDKAVSAVRPLA